MRSLAPEVDGVDLASYDHIIVAFSGGKDSLACLLGLLEQPSVRPRALEAAHHDVDGGTPFMDWPVTPDYCRKVCGHLGVPVYFSRRQGGFLREMTRQEQPTAPVEWQNPDGTMGIAGGRGPLGTRMRFPQVSANLSVRWCSSALKIDVCAAAIRNQARFDGKRTLVVTGERAEESSARAKYEVIEPHRAHSSKRHVDQWRPVLHWSQQEVWDIIRRHGIVAHPAYRLGWGRVSCLACIFGSPNQWASVLRAHPQLFRSLLEYERMFGSTIQRNEDILTRAERGVAYDMDPELVRHAMSEKYELPVFTNDWELPKGAFGESAGPT